MATLKSGGSPGVLPVTFCSDEQPEQNNNIKSEAPGFAWKVTVVTKVIHLMTTVSWAGIHYNIAILVQALLERCKVRSCLHSAGRY